MDDDALPLLDDDDDFLFEDEDVDGCWFAYGLWSCDDRELLAMAACCDRSDCFELDELSDGEGFEAGVGLGRVIDSAHFGSISYAGLSLSH